MATNNPRQHRGLYVQVILAAGTVVCACVGGFVLHGHDKFSATGLYVAAAVCFVAFLLNQRLLQVQDDNLELMKNQQKILSQQDEILAKFEYQPAQNRRPFAGNP